MSAAGLRSLLYLVLSVSLSSACHAATVSFDSAKSGTSVTTQYPGMAVSGGTIVTASNLSPAHSGAQELSSSVGQSMTLTFAAGQNSISGYYTALAPVMVSIYTQGSTTPTSTLTLPSSTPQAAFSVSGSNITRLVFSPALGRVTIDDLIYTPPAAAAPPEPASLFLMGTGLCLSSLLPAWRATQRRAEAGEA